MEEVNDNLNKLTLENETVPAAFNKRLFNPEKYLTFISNLEHNFKNYINDFKSLNSNIKEPKTYNQIIQESQRKEIQDLKADLNEIFNDLFTEVLQREKFESDILQKLQEFKKEMETQEKFRKIKTTEVEFIGEIKTKDNVQMKEGLCYHEIVGKQISFGNYINNELREGIVMRKSGDHYVITEGEFKVENDYLVYNGIHYPAPQENQTLVLVGEKGKEVYFSATTNPTDATHIYSIVHDKQESAEKILVQLSPNALIIRATQDNTQFQYQLDSYLFEKKNDKDFAHFLKLGENCVYVGDVDSLEGAYAPHGFGQLLFINGDHYIGSLNNGKREGEGKSLTKSGEEVVEISGLFKNDEIVEGEIVKSGKLSFKGSFKDGYMSNGVLYLEDDTYEGDFNNGLRHGIGKYTYSDKSSYSGEWCEGKKHGKGIFVDKDGKVYDSKWENDSLQELIEKK